MGRPLRFPIRAEDLSTPDRWRHTITLKRRHLALSPNYDDILAPEVVEWTRTAGILRGGWRFVIASVPDNGQPPIFAFGGMRNVIVPAIEFQMRFTRPNDALAFKMRWG